jgi:sugar diacid utilization regulator
MEAWRMKMEHNSIDEQLQKCAAELFKILTTTQSIAGLMDYSSKLLDNPIIAMERGGKILGYSGDVTEINEKWEKVGGSLYGSSEMLLTIAAIGDFDLCYSRDEPLTRGEPAPDSNYYIAARFTVDGHAVGHILVVGKNGPFSEFTKMALPLISKAVSCIYRIGMPSSAHSFPFAALLSDILDERLESKDVIKERLKVLGLTMRKHITVLLVEAYETGGGRAANHYLSEYIRNTMALTQTLLYRNNIVVLAMQDSAEPFRVPVTVSDMLARMSFKLGQSLMFTDLTDLKKHYTQAKVSVALSNWMKNPTPVVRYEEIAPYHLLEVLASKNDISQFVHPIITKIQAYDARYSTDFLCDLVVYLKNNCSLPKSASDLHIHRNTMEYRINKLKDIINNNLDDNDVLFHLNLSLFILRYLRN